MAKNGSAATLLPSFHKNKIKPVVNSDQAQQKSWLKRNWSNLLLMLILLIGVGLLAYPSVANWWNTYWSAKAVGSYMDTITNMTEEEYNYYWFRAVAYNERLAKRGAMWNLSPVEEKNYENVLNFDPSGMMGYIDIKKIDVKLPIYHGISEDVLSGAIGHIPGTSLPVGGEGSHCVISGHRGLPSARLFTDLDKLVEGDTFALIIMDRTLTYQVDQIRIVEPTNLSDLQIEKGKDYCTLVTCTPYGVNTHRLLIRGFRTENPNGNALVVADAMQIEPALIAPMIAVPILLLLVFLMFIWTGHKKRKKKKRIAMNGGIDPKAEIDPEDLLTYAEDDIPVTESAEEVEAEVVGTVASMEAAGKVSEEVMEASGEASAERMEASGEAESTETSESVEETEPAEGTPSESVEETEPAEGTSSESVEETGPAEGTPSESVEET